MSKLIINGVELTGEHLMVAGRKVIIDGIDVTTKITVEAQTLNIRITEGELGSLTCDGNVSITGNATTITAEGNVTAGAVKGSVTAEGNVKCDCVGGSVTAEGNVSCGRVGGSVKGANVRHA